MSVEKNGGEKPAEGISLKKLFGCEGEHIKNGAKLREENRECKRALYLTSLVRWYVDNTSGSSQN